MNVFNTLSDIVIGGYGADYPATYAEGDIGLIDTFASIFKSGFAIIEDNVVLVTIIAVSVGVPILAAVVSIFRGR